MVNPLNEQLITNLPFLSNDEKNQVRATLYSYAWVENDHERQFWFVMQKIQDFALSIFCQPSLYARTESLLVRKLEEVSTKTQDALHAVQNSPIFVVANFFTTMFNLNLHTEVNQMNGLIAEFKTKGKVVVEELLKKMIESEEKIVDYHFKTS